MLVSQSLAALSKPIQLIIQSSGDTSICCYIVGNIKAIGGHCIINSDDMK